MMPAASKSLSESVLRAAEILTGLEWDGGIWLRVSLKAA
jgi:hypothetical protein